MKLLIALALSVTLLAFCSCATREPVSGLSKEAIALEHARLADAREQRKAWWMGAAKAGGTLVVDLAGSALREWFNSSSGLSKDR